VHRQCGKHLDIDAGSRQQLHQTCDKSHTQLKLHVYRPSQQTSVHHSLSRTLHLTTMHSSGEPICLHQSSEACGKRQMKMQKPLFSIQVHCHQMNNTAISNPTVIYYQMACYYLQCFIADCRHFLNTHH